MFFISLLLSIITFYIGIRSDLQSSDTQGGRTCAARPYERHSFRSAEFGYARGTSEYSVMDELGRKLFDGSIGPNGTAFTINTENFTDGLYICRLVSGNSVYQSKFIVRH